MYKDGTFAALGVICVAVLLATILIAGVTGSASAGDEEKVTICHVSGNGHQHTLSIGYMAAFGPAGHFSPDGSPREGHLDDYLGRCRVPE